MASAQVLPNSGTSLKKKQQLEAGKKKLAEFRKNRAAVKKAASASQVNSADVDLHERQSSESERVRITNSDGIGTSDGGSRSVVEESETKTTDFAHKAEQGSSYDSHANPLYSTSSYNAYHGDSVPRHAIDEPLREPFGQVRDSYGSQEERRNDNLSSNAAYEIDTEQSIAVHPPAIQDIDSNSSQYNNFRLDEALSNNSDGPWKDFSVVTPVTSQVSVTSVYPERSGRIPLQNMSGYTSPLVNGPTSVSYEDSSSEVGKSLDGVFEYSNHLVAAIGERTKSNSVGPFTSSESGPSLWPSEYPPTSFRFDVKSSSNQVPPSPAVTGQRSRPSFLDSINMSRPSSTSFPITEPEKADAFNSKVHPAPVLNSSAFQNSMNSSVATNNGGDLFMHGANDFNMERKNFYSAKQDEDFAALEQHIEDLTQEKFSLQRALEASRVLAESLATENSALTDSYNQQGGVVRQLKYDMEQLQEEIKAQLVELEAVKIEYGNAQLECSAADERAKLLASEVIGLEEKALRLRSNELKLERQLENSQAEMSSYKKKISSLEKERQDLQFTIDALQEEKKLLQSKLRKASASGKFVNISKSPSNRKEASTSTEDLVDGDDEDSTPVTSNLEVAATAVVGSDASRSPLHTESRQFGLEGLSLSIPPDQSRMIQNINTLISELALEKEELMQALSAESSQSSKLKELNKELSQKLEVQTQRLELLTSQSMVNDNIPVRQMDLRTMQDNAAYADEGDEVVERVLGWIMKLFPGGSSRRQTIKRL